MGTSPRRRVIACLLLWGVLLGTWMGQLTGVVEAQGPYSAQIQRALRAIGLSGAAGVWTVPVKLADGTAAAPSLTFTNNTNRGIFNDTANTAIGFSVAGSPAAHLSGTAASNTFAVNGITTDVSNRAYIEITGENAGFGGALIRTTAIGTGSARRINIGTATSASIFLFTNNAYRWIIDGVTSVGNLYPNTDNTEDLGRLTERVRTGYFGTDVIVGGNSVTTGVATGYRIARGSTALDGTNPTPVATGLTTVIGCSSDLRRNTALTAGTAFLTHDAPSGATVDFYAWVLAGTASTGTETFDWVCVGT